MPSISLAPATQAELESIGRRLREHNEAIVGPLGFSPLHVLLRDDGGAVVGGVLGKVFLGWLFVETLWIAAEHRGGGHGAALLGTAEEEARARGCHSVWLDTFSFQAPGFYRRLGYREFGRLNDYPAGHARHFLWKPLNG